MREYRGIVDLPDLGPLTPEPSLACKRALLLQGPVGPFFARLAADLRRAGASIIKVNFNTGDDLFYRGPDVVSYRDELEHWAIRARQLMVDEGIDAIFLFGDRRPIHVDAIQIARELGISVWVFEEGYLRPDYITVEQGGVNGDSSLPRDASFYRTAAPRTIEAPAPLPVGNTSLEHAAWTSLYAIGKTFGAWRYPNYVHHRRMGAFYGAAVYTRGGFRKLRDRIVERGVVEKTIAKFAGRYFVMPLQVHCDSQLQHSNYASMEAFIDDVVGTFAVSAPADTALIVKHHPQDVPFRDYRRRLNKLTKQHGLAGRVFYIHEAHLPTLLKHARGVITMNSTVGTSALHHKAPVKVMGRAVYDIPGMTFRGSLSEFLREPGVVDTALFESFCRWLRAANQVNGSFYRRVPSSETQTGLPASLFVPASNDAPAAPTDPELL